MPERTEQLLTACQYLQGVLMAFGMRQKDLLVTLLSQMFLGSLLWGEAGMELSRLLVRAICPVLFKEKAGVLSDNPSCLTP